MVDDSLVAIENEEVVVRIPLFDVHEDVLERVVETIIVIDWIEVVEIPIVYSRAPIVQRTKPQQNSLVQNVQEVDVVRVERVDVFVVLLVVGNLEASLVIIFDHIYLGVETVLRVLVISSVLVQVYIMVVANLEHVNFMEQPVLRNVAEGMEIVLPEVIVMVIVLVDVDEN